MKIKMKNYARQLWLSLLLLVGATAIAVPGLNETNESSVAKIGDTEYATLEAAWAEVKDGETITLLADCTGNGIKAPQGKFTTGLTVDFAGHTYTVDGATVGSTGTETNGFQLLKDNKITFKGGTITSEKAKILVQNYSDLTLEGMTLTLNNANYTQGYTLSNNNGTVVIDGTTINANPAGGFAFDVCRYSSYPSVNVTVKGESVINGNVEVFASGSDAKNGFSLMLEGGTLNGEIVLDGSAKTAMANTPDKAKVSKSNALTDIAAPAGYMWKDNSDETSTLAKRLAMVTHCDDNVEDIWTNTNCSSAEEVVNVVNLKNETGDWWYTDRIWVYGELNANIILSKGESVIIAEYGDNANYTGTVSAAEGWILVPTNVKADFDETYGDDHKSVTLYEVRRDPNYAKIKIVKTDGTEYGYDALLSSSRLMNIGDGDKMILLDDVDYGYNVPWYPGFDLTIDLNGHTLTNTKGGVLGLSKNKTLTIIDSSESKTGKVALENIANSPVIDASSNNNAKLVIESGSVIAPSNSNKGAIVAGSNNEVSITGGCFAGKLSITEGSTATIQISGGVFSQEPAEEYCAEGYVPTFNADPETKANYPYAVKSKDDDVYELIDAENYPFMDLPSDIAVSSVTYKRSFSSTQVGKHQAWFVPMDYTITADDVANFTFYKIQMIAGAAEAGEADHDMIYLYIEPMSEGEVLKGNRPYTVKPKNVVTDYEFTAENTTLYAPTTKSRLNVTTSFHSYDFYGKYANDPYTGNIGDWFSLAQGSLHPNPASTTFRQYRWIIEVTANTINDDYSKIDFSIVEDGDATGIDRTRVINSDEVEGIYTTNGMMVDEPVRGINIIRYKNGKTEKIIVK